MSKQKTDKTLQEGFASPFSKVKFKIPRPFNGAPEGNVKVTSAIPATVTFSNKLVKAKLGENRYKKLVHAKRHGVKAPKRFVPLKGGVPYQEKGQELGYLACPLPVEGVVSPAADDLIPTMKEDGRVPLGLDKRAHAELVKPDLKPVHYASGLNDMSHLAMDLSTETIFKNRGSDFNGMAREAYTWRYYLTLTGFVLLLQMFRRRIRNKYLRTMYKIFGTTNWFGWEKWNSPFSVAWKATSLWDRLIGYRLKRAKRYGWRPVVRHFLISKGWLKPKVREVEWPAAAELRQTDGSYLAVPQSPMGRGLQLILDKAQALKVDFQGVINSYMALRWFPEDQIKAFHTSLEAAAKEPLTDGEQMYLFIVKTIVENPVPKAELPQREHSVASCFTCHGTHQKMDAASGAVVPCDDPYCGKPEERPTRSSEYRPDFTWDDEPMPGPGKLVVD